MIAVAAACFGLATLLFLWSYLLYPAIIVRAAGRRPAPTFAGGPASDVEVVISAADEAEAIGRRVANLLAQDPAPGYRVTIGCDGCRDDTARVARAAGNGRVHVVEFPRRRGKAAVLNDLVARSDAKILVFTDANTRFDAGAVARLVAPFADPAVGSVCGRLLLEAGEEGERTPETLFWDRESRVKEAEGRLGVCLGANGAIYAARRDRVRPLPEDTSLDDLLIPARIAHEGLRVVFAGDAVAREAAPRHARAERARRFRIGVGAGQVLRREGWLFDARRHPALTLAFVSRKAARWVAPVLALVGLLASVASPSLRPVALPVAVVAAALFAVPLRVRGAGVGGRLYYFCLMNGALAAGVLAGLFGMSRPAWSRTPRGGETAT